MTTCLYCPNRANSKEHLFPDWLNEVLGYVHPTLLFLGKTRGWRSDKPATHKLRVVCETCNNGWMSDIEDAAKPILTPLVLGQPSHLDVNQQQVVATWAFSRAIIGEQLSPDLKGIPADHRQWLFEHHEPPPQVRVFAAATDGLWWLPGEGQGRGNVHFSGKKMLSNKDQTHISPSLVAGALVGYAATILVRHLALQVVANILDGGALAYPADLAPFLTEVWPTTTIPMTWPPATVMSRQEVEHLIDAWRGDAPPARLWVPDETVVELATRPNRKARRAAERGKKQRP